MLPPNINVPCLDQRGEPWPHVDITLEDDAGAGGPLTVRVRRDNYGVQLRLLSPDNLPATWEEEAEKTHGLIILDYFDGQLRLYLYHSVNDDQPYAQVPVQPGKRIPLRPQERTRERGSDAPA